MTTSRHKVLGLALMAVLGLMALGAAGVQAATQGVFLLGGKPASGSTITANFEKKIGNVFSSSFGASNVPVTFSCKKLKIAEGKFLNEKEALGVIEFTECTVEEPKGCTVAEPIVAKAIVLALLHKPVGKFEETYLIAHPEPGAKAFTTLKFSGCVLPEEIEVKGLPVFKDCQNLMETEETTHLIEEVNPLKLAENEGLKFGAKEALMFGSAFVSVPINKSWSAH